MIGNIRSAGPHDLLRPSTVRVNADITTWGERDTLGTIKNDVGMLKMRSHIQETAKVLVKEFIILESNDDGSRTIPTKTFKPLYHDDASTGRTARRDDWGDTQPFSPPFPE